jgi:hypothetical protein
VDEAHNSSDSCQSGLTEWSMEHTKYRTRFTRISSNLCCCLWVGADATQRFVSGTLCTRCPRPEPAGDHDLVLNGLGIYPAFWPAAWLQFALSPEADMSDRSPPMSRSGKCTIWLSKPSSADRPLHLCNSHNLCSGCGEKGLRSLFLFQGLILSQLTVRKQYVGFEKKKNQRFGGT